MTNFANRPPYQPPKRVWTWRTVLTQYAKTRPSPKTYGKCPKCGRRMSVSESVHYTSRGKIEHIVCRKETR